MKTLRSFILSLAVIACGSLFAQESQKDLERISKNHGEYYFTLNVQQPSEIQTISQFCSVDNFDGKTKVTCYAGLEQYQNLLRQGYQPTLMMPPSLQVKAEMWDGNDRANYDWDAYPTYEAYEAMMYQFGTDHPDKCEILTLGTLESGRKILVARLNNGETEGKPKFLYTSTIHGDETTGWIMMLRLIDYLLENPNEPEVQNVMDNIDLFIGPLANPDGTYHAGNNNVNGAWRYNHTNYMDLNRNYADPHGGPHPDGNEYQLETLWFMQLAEDYDFVMGANYHGGSEVVNYPWDNTHTLHADDDWYRLVSREYADLCQQHDSNYMDDLNNGITNGADWYMIGGGRQDYMNGYHQCREVTIECSGNKLVPANTLPMYWDYNKEAIFAFMNQCLYGVHGVVTDSLTGQPIEATITVSGHDDQYSFVSSHLPAGDFHRPIKGGSYSFIFSAEGYCPKMIDVTVADYETVNLNVQLVPGSCILASFGASATQVAMGQGVSFTDESFGDIVAWNWSFEGGTPANSNQQNPTVTYNEVGDFDVTLTITDANGDSQTLTKENYIHVREAYNMQNGTVETCNALFYDAGGPSNNYGNNQNYTMTFKPDTEGSMIRATFSEFSTEANFDYLYIYDGSSANATLIGQYDGSDSPGEVTATNEEGALTFRFTSDQGVTAFGWVATVSCVGDYEPLMLEVTAEPELINEGETSQLNVTVTGGDGNYTYTWEPAETLSNPNIANPVATPTEPETIYKVVVTDGQGSSESGEVTVSIRDWSLQEDGFLPHVYPNPTKGNFTIDMRGAYSYTLCNGVGQQLLSGKAEGKANIEALLAPGVYFLQIIGEDGIKTEKLVIEK
ncbi:MAG: hypothetical protein AUK64_410 [bacterium P201]|nr:MAG: hypothetical protein AUK64_410 [bacterium P201]